MQKEMATIEQVAQDNHERARRLMKELSQMQHEYAELRNQVRQAARSPPGSGSRSQIALPVGTFLCGRCERPIMRTSIK